MEGTEWEPAPWTVRLVQQRLAALGTRADEDAARKLARDILRLEGTRLELIARGSAIAKLQEAGAAVQEALRELGADEPVVTQPSAEPPVAPPQAAPPAPEPRRPYDDVDEFSPAPEERRIAAEPRPVFRGRRRR